MEKLPEEFSLGIFEEAKMVQVSDKSVPDLWNHEITPEQYGGKEKFFDHLFEQYKLYVEMSDKISERRNLANTFFLTLHTLLLGIAGFTYEKGPQIASAWLNAFPLFAVLILCYVWWRLIRSYRQLNRAKFLVIGEYERRLPTRPYVAAEWKLLGEGTDPSLYSPLADVERWVPVLFAALYILGFLGIVLL